MNPPTNTLAPETPVVAVAAPVAVTPPPPRNRPARKVVAAVLAVVALAVALPLLLGWVAYRRSHSITDDAFVEAHIVNIAPQMVSGRIVRFLVDENDTVAAGQVLAEVDPVPYRDKLISARAQLDSARADLARQVATLGRTRKEVPIQIAIAGRSLVASITDRNKAEEGLTLVRDDVDRGIDQARAGVKAARAALTLAELEYGRFSRLAQQGASTQERQQQVTQSRDSAQAQLELAEAKLAQAVASRTQVDVARRSLESAQTGTEKAGKGVELAEIGQDQIREVELLVRVKELMVEQAARAVETAEHDLEYTRVKAPFPGIVVKRYRNLGDFAAMGSTLLSLYNPDLLYVEANLEETRLPGVAPGNPVRVEVDAFAEPFRGRVIWVNKSTGAEFALMPRNVVSGEFTRVVQRIPVRIAIERDDRWPLLRAGMSARVAIAHGAGDPDWASKAAREMSAIEGRYNRPDGSPSEPPRGDPSR